MRNNFVKVPIQDSTPRIPPHSHAFTLWFEVVEESALVDVFQYPYNERSREEFV